MINAYQLVMSKRSLRDLRAIHAYIAGDSLANADRLVQSIIVSLNALRDFPYQTKPDPQSAKLPRPARIHSIPPYLVYIRISERDKLIRVIHVRHGARLPPKRI